MGSGVPEHCDLRAGGPSLGGSLHDLNTVDGRQGEIEGISDVDREAVTEDSLENDDDDDDDDDDSPSEDCVQESHKGSLTLHAVGVDEERPALENNSRPSSPPYCTLTVEDILPIETARARFLDIIVDNFISKHVVEVAEPSGIDYCKGHDKPSKRKVREVHHEGDPRFALPPMYIANLYETLVNEANMRVASLDGTYEKTIGVALEAAGGLYRKLAKRFPRKGPCSFKRRELATSHTTRERFPELVVQEEKRVRFVVINGLMIVEKPSSVSIVDAEWFKRLTGRNEVVITERDYKYYSPRHKYRRTSQSVFHIPGSAIQEFSGNDGSSLGATSGFRLLNEPQSQQQSPVKHSMQQLPTQPQVQPLHQAQHQIVQQSQHAPPFPLMHQCMHPSHVLDIPQPHQPHHLSPHMACLQSVSTGHLAGRWHLLPTSPAKFCDECGSPYLRETSKFCSECGTKRPGI